MDGIGFKPQVTNRIIPGEYITNSSPVNTSNEDSEITKWNDALALFYKMDYVEAFPLIESMANNGHTYAQYELGFLYLIGYGVDKNFEQAMHYF